MLAAAGELLGRTGLRGPWIYVTDGGHYENLGLVEALRRGATEIIVFDASGDAPHSWSAFGQAVETARADLGVQIDLDPTPMTPPSDGRTPTLVVEGSCTYPDGAEARLVLCKLAMPKDVPASWDVAAWARSHKTFPHDSTAQQLYGDREFEAYRRLGELGGDRAKRWRCRRWFGAKRSHAPGGARTPRKDRPHDEGGLADIDGTIDTAIEDAVAVTIAEPGRRATRRARHLGAGRAATATGGDECLALLAEPLDA